MLRNRISVSFVSAVVAAIALTACSGCGNLDSPNVPASTRPSFGEMVYRILKASLQQSDTCSNEYVTELETHHSDFVTTFDYVIENGVQDNFPDLLGGTIKPFVDNGQLPSLVDQLAATVALLISNEFDPNRQTIQSIVNLSNAQTLLESSIAIQMAAAVLADPTITDKIHTLATIAQENDGVTYLMDDMFDVASYALEADPTPSTCTGIPTPDAQTTLLRTQGYVENPAHALGSPFYLARPDANGNPKVNVVGGSILAPFVDANHDGAADVNADGDPIDAAGQRIDIPMIGEDNAPGRDAYGRALDANGNLYYDYYDTKRTTLSYSMQIGADLFATKVHHKLPAIMNAVLGTPTACTDGVNCFSYPSANNVVGDIVWLVFEVAEYNRVSVLMRTMSDLLTQNPTVSEQLLVAVGDLIRALDASPISLTDTTITTAFIELGPLLAQILAAPNGGGIPTARVLVDVLAGLGAQGDALPEDTNYMLVNQYDADAPNNMEGVNYSLPRYSSGDDNRSGVEQLIELFDYADCGYIYPAKFLNDPIMWALWGILAGIDPTVQPGTLAEVLLDVLSKQSTSTVTTLISLIDGIQGLVGNNTLAWLVQNTMGCSASDSQGVAANLPAMKVLANSGGLDWLLPITRSFYDQGQQRLLIDIFVYISTDLHKDESIGPGNSAFRALGPVLKTLTTRVDPAVQFSTPFNRILDAMKILLTINASDGDGNAVDVLVDALAYMTATRTVQTRPITGTTPGSVTNTSYLTQILTKLKTLQQRVATGSAGDELSAVIDAATPLLTTTTGAGTGRTLANPNLRLLLATYTDVLAMVTTLPSANYLCYIHDVQTESTEFLNTRHFATLVRIMNHLATSPNAAGLEDWLLSMLRGNPDRSLEMYGRIMQTAAGALSSTGASSNDLANITNWLGNGLQASGAGGVRQMVQTLDGLLQSDTNGAILTMARTMIEPGPLASMERPVTTYSNITSEVGAIDPNNMCMATGVKLDPVSLEDTITGVSEFLTRNPNDGIVTGIEQVWQLVGAIAPAE